MKTNLILLLLIIIVSTCIGQKKMDEPISILDDLEIGWKKDKDTLKLVARNKLLTSMQIYFHSRADNSELNSFLLRPKKSIDLLYNNGSLPDSVYKSQFKDSIRISNFWGHPSLVNADYDYLYRLPFKKGKKYEVSQTFNGKTSHQSIHSKYAIDFQLDIGEPVYAAREGMVVKVIDWFTKQGGRDLEKAANKIIILHADGTLGYYAHLQYKGSFVQEGETVQRGQKIGISGLTGFTNGPHLHFVVRKDNDISIPIYFKGYEGKVLKKGKRYKVVE